MQPTLLRLFDILFSLIGIVLSLPIIIAISILGLLDTGSPFFFQQRVGVNRKLFMLVKFRTMSLDTQSVGTHLVDSTAITKLGTFLRKSKLDELPQLFNVLFGQMSLVGPRPCLPNQTELIDERNKRQIFTMRPGITGLAQVNEVDMSTPRKLARFDQLMIKNMGICLYIKLVFVTTFGKGFGDRVQ